MTFRFFLQCVFYCVKLQIMITYIDYLGSSFGIRAFSNKLQGILLILEDFGTKSLFWLFFLKTARVFDRLWSKKFEVWTNYLLGFDSYHNRSNWYWFGNQKLRFSISIGRNCAFQFARVLCLDQIIFYLIERIWYVFHITSFTKVVIIVLIQTLSGDDELMIILILLSEKCLV